jgi:acyl-CoA thioesterase
VQVPTVDLTIHFRDEPAPVHDWCLARFVSRHASHGFVEEDGEIWSRDGRLLAQSRQLALMSPRSP